MFCRTQGVDNIVKISYKAVLFAVVILLIDQITKYLAYAHIPSMGPGYHYPYGGIGVFKDFLGIEFSINFMTNTGAAWGFLGDYQVPLILLRIGLIIGTIIYLIYFNRQASWQIPLLLIMAGAIGNVIDYFTYGYVVDMFHFVLWGYDFPIFNVADSAISIGIAILLLLSWLEPEKTNAKN